MDGWWPAFVVFSFVLCSFCAAIAQPQPESIDLQLEQIGTDYVKDPAASWAAVQRLRPIIEKSGEPALWAKWNLVAATVEAVTGNAESALSKAELALEIYQSSEDPIGIAESLWTKGELLAQMGRYRDSIAAFRALRDQAENVEDSDEYLGAALLGLGGAYSVMGNFATALQNLTDAYTIFRERGDDESIAAVLGLLGNAYADIDATEKAIEMYSEAAEYDTLVGNELNLAVNLHNIARARIDLEEYDLALADLDRATEICRRVGGSATCAYVEYARGLAYMGLEQGATAEEHFLLAAMELEAVGDTFQLALVDHQLARIALARDDAARASELSEQSAGRLQQGVDEKHLVEIYKTLASAYAAEGRFEEAYQTLSDRGRIMEETASAEQAQRIAHLRVAFDTDRVTEAAAALEAENADKQQRLEAERLQKRIVLVGSGVILVVLAFLVFLFSRQKALQNRLKLLANTDSLTELLSRRRLFELAELERQRADRYQLPLALFILDLDFFKSINDRHGHAVGDDVLKEISRILATSMREYDHLGRMGGEEFMALLPHTDKDEAMEVAKRLVNVVAEADYETIGVDERLTVSVGVASYQGPGDSITQVVRRADAALYQAKADGRNRARAEWNSTV